VTLELETKLRAFIPEYIPAVGEVDAFLKIPKPDAQPETLGLIDLDEPKLNQSKKAKLDLIFQDIHKKKNPNFQSKIHSIINADKNPKEIASWINDVNEN
jgi:intraflagellar transport protein 46